jgi:hypothetical protein
MIGFPNIDPEEEDQEYRMLVLKSKLEEPVKQRPNGKVPRPVLHYYPQEKIICSRCGGFGHKMGSCSLPLPTIHDLQQVEKNDLEFVISQIVSTGNFSLDDFGYFDNRLVSDFDFTENFTNTIFCINCGQPKHTIFECPFPIFQDFLNQVGKDVVRADSQKQREIQYIFNKMYHIS